MRSCPQGGSQLSPTCCIGNTILGGIYIKEKRSCFLKKKKHFFLYSLEILEAVMSRFQALGGGGGGRVLAG